MPRSTTLPIMAGLSIVGAALGVTLGRSAIAEIDPAYFADPEVPFHADLAPYRSPDWAQVQAAEYRQVTSAEGLGTGCVGCGDYPIEYVPRPDPAVASYGWAAAAEPLEEVTYEAPERDPEMERVQLYASYPVSAEEAQQEEPAPAAEEEEALAYAGTE